jgi:hypothetical protein
MQNFFSGVLQGLFALAVGLLFGAGIIMGMCYAFFKITLALLGCC